MTVAGEDDPGVIDEGPADAGALQLASGDLGDAAGGQLGDPHALHEFLSMRRDLGART